MRALGIDLGEKRIGLAVSDVEGGCAVPLAAFARTSDRAAILEIARIAEAEGVGLLVVGDPRRADGSQGEASRRAERFAGRLAAATGLPVRRVDEALTSFEARRRLEEAGIDPRHRPERVDMVAAQLLLEDALGKLREEGG